MNYSSDDSSSDSSSSDNDSSLSDDDSSDLSSSSSGSSSSGSSSSDSDSDSDSDSSSSDGDSVDYGTPATQDGVGPGARRSARLANRPSPLSLAQASASQPGMGDATATPSLIEEDVVNEFLFVSSLVAFEDLDKYKDALPQPGAARHPPTNVQISSAQRTLYSPVVVVDEQGQPQQQQPGKSKVQKRRKRKATGRSPAASVAQTSSRAAPTPKGRPRGRKQSTSRQRNACPAMRSPRLPAAASTRVNALTSDHSSDSNDDGRGSTAAVFGKSPKLTVPAQMQEIAPPSDQSNPANSTCTSSSSPSSSSSSSPSSSAGHRVRTKGPHAAKAKATPGAPSRAAPASALLAVNTAATMQPAVELDGVLSATQARPSPNARRPTAKKAKGAKGAKGASANKPGQSAAALASSLESHLLPTVSSKSRKEDQRLDGNRVKEGWG